MSENKMIKRCHWCNKELYEKDIEELSNERAFGYYITCPNCKNQNVIQEIDLTRECL